MATGPWDEIPLAEWNLGHLRKNRVVSVNAGAESSTFDLLRTKIVQMAREAGAKTVYFASAAPPVRYPNVYGIDMPAAAELIAHGRTDQEVCDWIGADGLVYQDLEDLIEAVGKKGKTAVQHFDTSVFNGEYVTGDITEEYLTRLEAGRNDDAKTLREEQRTVSVIGLHNDR